MNKIIFQKMTRVALVSVGVLGLVACGTDNEGESTETESEENTEQTATEGSQNANSSVEFETDDSGKVILPDFETVESGDAGIGDYYDAEAEELALVRLEDFELNFTDEGGMITNNSDYYISEANFDILINDGESDTSVFFYDPVGPGEVFPHIINEERIQTSLDSGAIDPDTTTLTGMWLWVNHEDGYQEIYDRYDGNDSLSVHEHEKIGVSDIEQVYITADELEIDLSAEGESIVTTFTNNSEYPLTDIILYVDAANVASPGRDEYVAISMNIHADQDLKWPILPGETVTKTSTFDTAYEDIELTEYNVLIGTEDDILGGTTIYNYLLDTYHQNKH